jgi:hypothetical protein
VKSPNLGRSRRNTAAGAGKRLRGCPLVLVEWEDSRQPIGAWNRIGGFEAADACKCVSVGWLIHDGKEKKVLAPNVADIEDEHNVQMSGMICIPARCITRIQMVREYQGITSSSACGQAPASARCRPRS